MAVPTISSSAFTQLLITARELNIEPAEVCSEAGVIRARGKFRFP